MNRMLLALFLVLFTFSGYCNVPYPDLFKLDEKSLNVEFAELNKLENYVISNQGITLNELFKNNNVLTCFLNKESTSSPTPMDVMFTIDDMDWGAFAWGFCCCPCGFFTVAISDEKDNNQKLSYWIGVITSTLLDAAVYGLERRYLDWW